MTEEKRLGRYEIVRELGRGGMGIVLEGRDPMIDRSVALKIIKLSGMGSAMEERELRERFFIEAKAAGRLIHPHIVTIYDVGEEGGKSFMAMEFVEGVDLAGILSDEGPLPLARAAKIVAQIADGLAYAHEHHIVHRDVKPGNILITRGDRVKITDFGLARLTTAAGSVTQTGHAVGSPSYMSPEQVQGLPLDGRSDLFSLGVLFYELVTGRRPFEGEGLTNIIFKIIKDNPLPASALNPQLPPALDRVIGKMLAKSPEERYGNGHELAAALAPFTSTPETDADRERATVAILTSGKTVDFESDRILEVINDGKKGNSGKIIAAVAVTALLLTGGLFAWLKSGDGTPDAPASATLATEAPTTTPSAQPTPLPPKGKLTIRPSVPATLHIDGAIFGPVPAKEIETAAGAHTLRLTAPGYQLWEIDIDLAPGAVATFSPNLQLAPGTALVTSVPAGVAVSVDGKPQGKTPLTLPSLNPGRHEVVLSGEGLVEERRELTVTPDAPIRLTVTMTDDAGTLRVVGPAGASILVDGENRGTAPATLTLPVGRHTVALAKGGFHSKSLPVNVERGKMATLDASLAPRGYGTLRVTSIPWAEAWVNGKKVGPTPRTVEKVEEGSVKVKLVNPGYRPFATTVTLAAGGTATVSHSFTEAEELDTPAEEATAEEKGILLITARPAGTVFIDGRPLGATPVRAEGVAAGDRKVVIKREGLPDYARTITVVGGIVTRLAVE
ncbi:MAG: serine/threonine protein kinase [Nitrospinae bacterium]|nr:serine/threonine protein kinase [Nitrospinota bacterium]